MSEYMGGAPDEEDSHGNAQGQTLEATRAAIAQEVAHLQQTSAQLTRNERDLELAHLEVRSQIARYEREAYSARQHGQDYLALQIQEECQPLLGQFSFLQQQLAALRGQRERLARREAYLLAQMRAIDAGLPIGSSFPGQAGQPPAAWQQPQPSPKRTSRLLLLALAGMALLVVLVPLGLTVLSRSSTPKLAQQTPAASTPTPTPTPTEAPPAFTPAGTAPTSNQCSQAVRTLCYSPEQIQQAFRLNSLYQQGYDGRGQTIVILGAGKTTTLKQDLQQFDLAWGLPDPPNFTIQQPFGAPAPYKCVGGVDELQGENTLDVEWAHAIAPGANILLLIGSNDSGGTQQDNCSFAGVEDAFVYAVHHKLGNIITISYGGSELGGTGETSSQQTQDRQFFTQAHSVFQEATNAGITVLAATGDAGATNPDGNANSVWPQRNVSWPASDPNVLAVGGTTLTIQDANGHYGSEIVWNQGGGATGGGVSAVFAEPDYQKVGPDQGFLQGQRGIPDVAFPAAENYILYGSFTVGTLGLARSQWNHWDIVGGTSAASPSWAGLIAILDQMNGKPVGLIQPALYSLQGKGMHDITVGNNSLDGVQGYEAGPGYDLVSGWGTPIADQLLPALVQALNSSNCQNGQRGCN